NSTLPPEKYRFAIMKKVGSSAKLAPGTINRKFSVRCRNVLPVLAVSKPDQMSQLDRISTSQSSTSDHASAHLKQLHVPVKVSDCSADLGGHPINTVTK